MPQIVITLEVDDSMDLREQINSIQHPLSSLPQKITNILRRAPGCLCTAPEADDQLRDTEGRLVGTITVI